MKTQAISCALFALLLVVCQAGLAQQPALLPPVVAGDVAAKEKDKQKEKNKDKAKDKDKTPDKKAPEVEPSSISLAVGDFMMFNPGMMGYQQNNFAARRLTIPGTQSVVVQTGPLTAPTVVTTVPVTRTVLVPNPNRGGFNIGEAGESAIPRDRVFFSWNTYSGVGYGPSGQNAPLTTVTTVQTPPNRFFSANFATTTTTTTVTPGASRVDVNREMFGFEKTFLDGYASIEVRAPLAQQGGTDAGFGVNDFGEVTVIGKYALYMNRNTGNVFSTGLAVTFPTSQSIATTNGNFADTLFQPFIGYVWNFDRFYVQAFHSIVIPTDKNDVTLAFNSVGLNYWLYRGNPDRPLSFIVPTIEAHVITPLNHRDLNGPIVVPDTVVLTTGVQLGVFRNATLSLGVATPVTGPRIYNIEGFVQFQLRF